MLAVNEVPRYELTHEPARCCPRFQPAAWDDQELVFDHKPFVRASSRSFFHVPLDMARVFERTFGGIEEAHAAAGGLLVMSHDESPWRAEHLFAVDKDVPGAEMVHLDGTFLTKVFEGPYSKAAEWCAKMEQYVRTKGRALEALYFFYTTCPRCSRAYGANFVVGIAKVR